MCRYNLGMALVSVECLCRSAVLRFKCVCGSGLPVRSMCSDHMRVELSDDNGDVVAVHACQLLGQRQHF